MLIINDDAARDNYVVSKIVMEKKK